MQLTLIIQHFFSDCHACSGIYYNVGNSYYQVANHLYSRIFVADVYTFIVLILPIDIDECHVGFPCHQQCNNTVGSYRCSCYTGYALSMDDRCIGKQVTVVFSFLL